MDLYVHAQTVDTRSSSPIFQAPGYEAKQVQTQPVYNILCYWDSSGYTIGT